MNQKFGCFHCLGLFFPPFWTIKNTDNGEKLVFTCVVALMKTFLGPNLHRSSRSLHTHDNFHEPNAARHVFVVCSLALKKIMWLTDCFPFSFPFLFLPPSWAFILNDSQNFKFPSSMQKWANKMALRALFVSQSDIPIQVVPESMMKYFDWACQFCFSQPEEEQSGRKCAIHWLLWRSAWVLPWHTRGGFISPAWALWRRCTAHQFS